MKSYRKELWFNTPDPGRVRQYHAAGPGMHSRQRRRGGSVLVNAMHITASVFINDDEAGLHQDYGVWLEKLAPARPAQTATITTTPARTTPTRTSSGR